MENRTNQAGQQSSASSQNNPSAGAQNTSSAQSRSQNATASSQGQPSYTSQSNSQQSPSAQQGGQSSNSRNQQNDRQGQESNGMLGGITSKLGNIQMPQAVKNFGESCARSYNGLSTTQKVVGGAALALGASYWAAKSSGWVGQGKGMNKNRNKSGR